MKIALSHFRVGETDGVSLEMDKWAKVLEGFGHEVVYIAGSCGTTERKTFIIPEMYYKSEINAELKKAFYSELGDYTEESLRGKIEEIANSIKNQLVKLINTEKIDCIVPNNILSLGHDIPTAIGFTRAIEETGVKAVCHHHDFWWESSRPHYQSQTTEWGRKVIKEYFPPLIFGDKMKHCVINSLAQNGLRNRTGIEAVVVPNVFDFNMKVWEKDEYNSTFLRDLGINENQVLLLQATRVTNRKAIELAVDLVEKLNNEQVKGSLIGKKLYNGKVIDKDTEFVLAMVGLHEGINNYEEKLEEHIKAINAPVIINPNLVDHSRKEAEGKKIYSLWDAYVYADVITYPSIQEGWGNQFLEALFAKKPIVVFEYDVYRSDIAPKGFEVASLGAEYETEKNGLVHVKEKVISEVADKVAAYITDDSYRTRVVDKNFEIGKEYFSMEALAGILKGVFQL